MNKPPPSPDWALTAAFITAAQDGLLEIVSMLLEAGADLHADQERALRLAARSGQFPVMKLLLAKGADGRVEGPNGFDTAREALYGGHKEAQDLIAEWLSKPPKPASAPLPEKTSILSEAFIKAAAAGNLEVVSLLLAAGADVHAEKEGALRMAARGGHASVMRVLLAHGADGDLQGDNGVSAWHEAFWNGHDEACKVLGEWSHKTAWDTIEDASRHPRPKP